jgi:uncharacterized protein (TIGR02271 family)
MNDQMIGQRVYSSDGSELGTVKEVRGAYFKVDAPMQPDYWLRTDTCRSDGGRLVVMDDAERYENVDALEREGTGAYARGETYAETTTTEHAHHTGRDDERRAGVERERLEDEDEETLRLREERLRVGKEREQAGEVRLGKQVVERTETAEVPLREERVVIERRAVNKPADGDVDLREKTIEVPVERERAVVEKEAVVTEEVGVRKEAVERTQQVQGTVRKEELVVEGEGDVVEGGRNLNAPQTGTYQRERAER